MVRKNQKEGKYHWEYHVKYDYGHQMIHWIFYFSDWWLIHNKSTDVFILTQCIGIGDLHMYYYYWLILNGYQDLSIRNIRKGSRSLPQVCSGIEGKFPQSWKDEKVKSYWKAGSPHKNERYF